MDKIIIRGGRPLSGRIPISGAKNAALTLMPAAILTEEPLTLRNLPRLADIDTFSHLLNQHGVSLTLEGSRPEEFGRVMTLKASRITNTVAPYDIVRRMRASVLVLGPLLARCGEATVSLPGGCAIGTRPIDLHLKGLETLGARIELTQGYVKAIAPDGLKGGVVRFPFVSVGATENVLMAATLAHGETVIENAAREPEIVDLAHCLQAMGAEIDGIGTERLVVQGKTRLHGATYAVMADRIEAGSYACAAAITGGELELLGIQANTLGAVIEAFDQAGVAVTPTREGLKVARRNGELRGISVTTAPYPGFPTDMQAQFMAMLALADGASVLTETIFENRYMHVPELARMGADIQVRGRSAFVRGVPQLTGAPVMATDLRASMSLVLAGLAAQGETTVNRIYHLDRGYERLEEKLSAVGADIERVSAG
ncbi:UDP-N-acetylglucosamine 1-carboxyvinyltransferase [Pedomonas sp. V897]|uniref:UDP-N-acetylglucosamine 1-carboxyvinyltransferase n=1 Tax=Pedomonas sp. V897 TaxID=3446482 RepID=UPI003EE34292